MRPYTVSFRDGARRGTVALCAALLTCVALGGAGASDDAIEVHGNRRLDPQVIRNHFHASHGGLGAAELDAALKELYATGLFDDVKIARSGGRIVVTVVEAPVIAKLQFEGNKQFKDKDLQKEIALKAGGSLTKAAVQADSGRIAEMYRRGGRFDARVEPKTITHGDRVDLIFEIKEGAKTGVASLAFNGNRAFADWRLKKVVSTTQSDWFSFLRTSDVYDPDRIEADRDALLRFYRKNGYTDASVDVSAAFDPKLRGFAIRFTLDEGERYKLRSVDIVSHAGALKPEALRGALHLAAGDTYDGDAVDKAVGDITAAAGKAGHPFVTVHPRPTRDPAAKSVDLAFVVDEAGPSYIERIVIHGNTDTREEVIRREFEVAEGDPYQRALLDRAEKRLKKLGLFKSVKITTAAGTTPERMIVNVEVQEDRTGDFGISGGYSTQAGFVGEVTLSERNFLGLGQYVKISATIGQYLLGGKVSFVEPYLLGTHLSLGTDVFYNETLTNTTQSYGSTSYGGDIKIGAPIADGLSTQARYSLIDQSVSVAPTLMDCIPGNAAGVACAGAAVKQAAINGPLLVSSAGTTIAYDTLDDPKHPHDGLHAELRQDVAGLGGDVDYLKTTGDVRYYQSLNDDIVASDRLQGGYVTPFGGQTLPLLSGFFGGPTLVRGFAVNGFGPRDVTPGTTMDNIGGSAYWANSSSLQSAIPGLPPEVALKAEVFADAGSLWGYRGQTSFPALSQSLTVADTKAIRASLGSGVIWDSPFGQLRVDYAYPISKAPYDVTQRLYFGVGGF